VHWYVESAESDVASRLRREVGAYLRRHAAPGSDLAAADLIVAELVANALEHAPGPLWVRVDWSAERPRLEVHDLGPGFELRTELPQDPLALRGRGLAITAALTDELHAAAKAAGGTKVSAVLPVRRAGQVSHAAPVQRTGLLPADEEADADGMFGKQAFLGALVVQLARAVNEQQGPIAAEQAVAQVGMEVGSRMEAAFRSAHGIVGTLTPEQIAELYVRLKAAIDGDFYVIEADERRIVLGNRACPFGDAVKRAPGLCQMTSSVFGGIAARNAGGADVLLEERIALGDPECRVVVWLGGERSDRPDAARTFAS